MKFWWTRPEPVPEPEPEAKPELPLVIPAGTDYADAIEALLKKASAQDRKKYGFGYAGYRRRIDRTGQGIPAELECHADTDWWSAADDLAAECGRKLITLPERFRDEQSLSMFGTHMILILVDQEKHEAEQARERQAATELAFHLHYADVDKMWSEMTRKQWEDWKRFLAERR